MIYNIIVHATIAVDFDIEAINAEQAQEKAYQLFLKRKIVDGDYVENSAETLVNPDIDPK